MVRAVEELASSDALHGVVQFCGQVLGPTVQLMQALGIAAPAGVSPPRMHSLRHSFAVGCLLRWYRQGLDPAARLHRLSTFMGHVDPSSTAVYLTITPALLQEANRRFEGFAAPIWTEVAR